MMIDVALSTNTVERGQHVVLTAAATGPDPAAPGPVQGSLPLTLHQHYKNTNNTYTSNFKYLH